MCGLYEGIKLPKIAITIYERAIESRIIERLHIHDIQSGFMSEKSTMDAIFIPILVQEIFRVDLSPEDIHSLKKIESYSIAYKSYNKSTIFALFQRVLIYFQLYRQRSRSISTYQPTDVIEAIMSFVNCLQAQPSPHDLHLRNKVADPEMVSAS